MSKKRGSKKNRKQNANHPNMKNEPKKMDNDGLTRKEKKELEECIEKSKLSGLSDPNYNGVMCDNEEYIGSWENELIDSAMECDEIPNDGEYTTNQRSDADTINSVDKLNSNRTDNASGTDSYFQGAPSRYYFGNSSLNAGADLFHPVPSAPSHSLSDFTRITRSKTHDFIKKSSEERWKVDPFKFKVENTSPLLKTTNRHPSVIDDLDSESFDIACELMKKELDEIHQRFEADTATGHTIIKFGESKMIDSRYANLY